jgi:L-arabinose isomerase
MKANSPANELLGNDILEKIIRPKIGLLPLYIELYDTVAPEKREKFESFLHTIINEIRKRNIDVVEAPVCRVKDEFSNAIRLFEDEQVNAIVTLHLAYSPSLESADILASTELPIIILDTTPSYEFGSNQNPDDIFFNHGIHGVQDMCNLLIRYGKAFQIETGHWKESDVIDRVVGWAHAAALAERMKNARVGTIGNPFKGMGDFFVPKDKLKTLIGIETIECDRNTIIELTPDSGDDSIREEMSHDIELYRVEDLDENRYRETIRICLAVRRWIEKEKLTAFTMNFLDFNRESGFPTPPFMEASKAMARGIGYAGEGDVLTAALVGALLSVYPNTTFAEMFCPDWQGDSIFLSHMGEFNINLAAEKAKFIQMDYQYSDAEDPVLAVGRLKDGRAVLVDLAPGVDESFTLVIAPGVMIGKSGADRFENTVHGWFKLPMPINEFLIEYSLVGGTHHWALVYGDVAAEIQKFGKLMGWKVVVID